MSKNEHLPTIKIEVTTDYLGVSDEPTAQQHNVFSYTIDITNQGQDDCQLLRRYWLITDGNGKEKEVSGDGVIGQQPVIAPGETFSYTSASMIETEVGTMQGHYEFELPNKTEFKAPIPVFTIAKPNTLH